MRCFNANRLVRNLSQQRDGASRALAIDGLGGRNAGPGIHSALVAARPNLEHRGAGSRTPALRGSDHPPSGGRTPVLKGSSLFIAARSKQTPRAAHPQGRACLRRFTARLLGGGPGRR